SMSALTIPDKARELLDELARPDLWNVVKEVTREDLGTLRKIVPIVRNSLAAYSDDEVVTALEALRTGKPSGRPPLRTAELEVFRAQPDEVEGVPPPPRATFHARRLPAATHPLPPKVERIVVAKKLRQV